MAAEKTVTFTGDIVRTVYDSDTFAVYALNVPEDVVAGKHLKRSKFGSVSVCGNISGLQEGVMYDFIAVEKQTKHGYSYEVRKCTGSSETSENNTVLFLTSILTENQAFELLKTYPDIVNMIIQGRDGEVDLSKLHGIGDYTFDLIKKKIIQNHDNIDLLSFFGGAVSLKTIAKIREKYPTIESVKKLFKKDPYGFLTDFQGIAFSKADKILLDMQKEQNLFDFDLKTSPQRCLAYIKFKLDSMAEEEGSTKYDLIKLKEDVDKMVPSCAKHFTNCIKNEQIWYNAEELSVSMKYIRNMEEYCAEVIFEGLDNPVVWDIDIEKYNKVDEFDLTSEQIKALGVLCKNNVCILNGNAGSGKSSSIKAVINMLEDNKKTYLLMSPTARAGRVLKNYTNRPASTIHRGYGYSPANGWQINTDNKLDVDVLILDESSMIGVSLMYHVLQGLDLTRTKLLLVGDSAQLSSVDAGNVLHDIINSGVVPVTSLTKIFRYQDGGLTKVATDIRTCRNYLPKDAGQHKTLNYGADKDYSFVTCSDANIVKETTILYQRMLESGRSMDDIQVITAYNVGSTGTQAINKSIQMAINKNVGKNRRIVFGDVTFYEEDLVIQKKNNYHTAVYDPETGRTTGDERLVCNGDVGRIIEINDGKSAIIKFDDTYYKYQKSEFTDVKLGYAISVHSSQGSQSDIVIFATPKNQMFMMSSNLLYVGCTRSKKRCIHIGDPYMVMSALKKKDERHRNTFLCDFLQKGNATLVDRAS